MARVRLRLKQDEIIRRVLVALAAERIGPPHRLLHLFETFFVASREVEAVAVTCGSRNLEGPHQSAWRSKGQLRLKQLVEKLNARRALIRERLLPALATKERRQGLLLALSPYEAVNERQWHVDQRLTPLEG